MTSLHGVYGVGAIAGPWFVELFRADGVEVIYGIAGVMSGVAGLLYWVLTRDLSENTPTDRSDDSKQVTTIKFTTFLPFALAVLLFSGANFTASDWLHYYTNEVIGAGNLWATIVTSAFWIAMTGGRFALGIGVAHWGESLILRVSALSAILGSLILVFPFVSTFSVTVGAAMLGLGLAPIYPILIVSAANLYPESRGKVTGRLAAAGAFGAIVLPALQGWLMTSQSHGLVVVLFSTIALGIVTWFITSKN